MKSPITYEEMQKLLDASVGSIMRNIADEYISKHYYSCRYKSSRMLCDCIVLNLLLFDEITTESTQSIITMYARHDKTIYTSVKTAFSAIKRDFIEYAKTVVALTGEIEYMPPANLIVYVISRDMSANERRLNRDEIYKRAYSFGELYDLEHGDER